MRFGSYSVPGVYRRPTERVHSLPRVRTDVAGFVGVAGPNRLHEAVAIEDWRSYEIAFLRDEDGRPLPPPGGAMLADAVRAFFANGGARCWVVNIRAEIDANDDFLLYDMLGEPRLSDHPLTIERLVFDVDQQKPLPRQIEITRTGLELLLTVDEVSILVMPELDAMVPAQVDRVAPPLHRPGCFMGCADPLFNRSDDRHLPPAAIDVTRLFSDTEVQQMHRAIIDRCGRVRWRIFALLAPSPGLTVEQVIRWRDNIAPSQPSTPPGLDPDFYSAAALYWPWPLAQLVPGGPVQLRSPVGFVAGIFARKDLGEGPQAPPANADLVAVVGLQTEIDEPTNARAYDSGVNVLRAFAGYGVQLWGARTLVCVDGRDPAGDPMSFINVRRCLSAIERSIERIGQPVVFEPNLPLLRAKLTQMVFSYLLTAFDAGAFAGATPEQSFFVRCDATNNPADGVAAGRLLCEVGVAIAEPAEFIVFRVGRSEGVVEIEEQP